MMAPTRIMVLALCMCGLLAAATASGRASGAARKLQQAVVQKNFSLPPLLYATSALEPLIDNQTMRIHHDLHHAAYIRNLNAALKKAFDTGHSLYGISLSKLSKQVGTGKLCLPKDQETVIRNNAMGAWNHALFWRVMSPAGSNRTAPTNTSALGSAIDRYFGSMQAMVDKLSAAAAAQFGSGWAWLIVKPKTGKLLVVSTPNQDNPLSPVGYKGAPGIPILGVDVWEHAYYLKYQNLRPAYVSAWWSTVNWNQVALNFEAAKAKNTDFDTIIGMDANVPK